MAETIAERYYDCNSSVRVPFGGRLLCNAGMECRDIRRQNLQALIKEHRTAKAVADLADTAPNYLNEIKRGERGMGNDLARQIETRLKLGHGWMDQPHNGADAKGIIPHSKPFAVVARKNPDTDSKGDSDDEIKRIKKAHYLVDLAAYESNEVYSAEEKESMVDIVIKIPDAKMEIGTVKALLRLIK